MGSNQRLHLQDEAGRFAEVIWGFPKIRGTLFGGPYNKDYSILGSIFGETTISSMAACGHNNGQNLAPLKSLRDMHFHMQHHCLSLIQSLNSGFLEGKCES